MAKEKDDTEITTESRPFTHESVQQQVIQGPEDDASLALVKGNDEDQEPEGDDVPAEPEEQPKETDEESEDDAGDDDTASDDDGTEDEGVALSPAVIYAASDAGIKLEELTAFGSEEAAKAAIEMVQARAVQREEAAVAPEEKEDAPELPAWVAAELPEGLKENLDPDLVKWLEERDARTKEAFDTYRAAAEKGGKDSGSGEVAYAQLAMDNAIRDFVGTNPEYKDALGDGFMDEVSDTEWEGRAKLDAFASQLRNEEAKRGIKPKRAEIIKKAAAAVFPDIATKTKKRSLAKKLTTRAASKIEKPSATKRDSLSPREKALAEIRAKQTTIGVTEYDD